MLEIYFLILPAIIIYVLILAVSDRTSSFEKYLKIELGAKGLEFTNSIPCTNINISEIENIPIIKESDKRRVGIGVMAGGYASLIDSTYKIIRKVSYKDSSGKNHESYAAIEFSGFFTRRYLGTSWNPEIKAHNQTMHLTARGRGY